jgi:drug/metabolite transporter (DMT)-like permease
MRDAKFGLADAGIKYAILASVSWGISFVIFSPIIHQYNWLYPTILLRFFTLICVLIVSSISKISLNFKIKKQPVIILGTISIIDVAAYFSYSIGLEKGLTSIVSPIAATFPLVTVLLARVFFKEKLVWNQLLGIIGIITGVVLLSMT